MKILTKLIIMLCLFAACQVQTTNQPAPKPVPVAPVTPPKPKTYCEQAQVHLEQLCLNDSVMNQYCCAIVMLTKKGKTFAQVCEETQAKGVFLNPECIASVTTCDDIDFCASSHKD